MPFSRTNRLAPAAYDESALPSLRLARSSRLARQIGKAVLVLLVVGALFVAIAPWQQSVKGTGNVIAFAPSEREQTIEAPIKGRVVRLGDGIYENAFVTKGQLIAEIADIDAEYLFRLEAKLSLSRFQVSAAEELLRANRGNLEAARTVVSSFESQVAAYQQVKEQVVAAAESSVKAARNRVEAELEQLAEQRAALAQVEADYDRQKKLFEERIASELKFQEAERKLRESQAKVERSNALVRSAENELAAKQSERNAMEQKAQADIEYAFAALRKAIGDVAKAESDVAKAQADVNKAEQDLLETQTRFARQQNQSILAPFDGFVTRIAPNQNTRILKEGDPICVIVPDTADRAVQVWLKGIDAPLVQPGRHVRLQFEGWPAMQFAGWPSVAVGTFGGEVVSVDAIDDGQGRFRILVRPDSTDRPWPSERFLRQGVRANGWVILEQVPLWYEIWRIMNGFPPVVSVDEPLEDSVLPKLPKP